MSFPDANQLSVSELRTHWVPAADLLKQLAFDAVTKQQLTAGKTDKGISKVTKMEQIDFRYWTRFISCKFRSFQFISGNVLK